MVEITRMRRKGTALIPLTGTGDQRTSRVWPRLIPIIELGFELDPGHRFQITHATFRVKERFSLVALLYGRRRMNVIIRTCFKRVRRIEFRVP